MDMVIAEKARLEEDNKELRASFDKVRRSHTCFRNLKLTVIWRIFLF
jgi:hypothetical protein